MENLEGNTRERVQPVPNNLSSAKCFMATIHDAGKAKCPKEVNMQQGSQKKVKFEGAISSCGLLGCVLLSFLWSRQFMAVKQIDGADLI